jgi:hypothetical protein
MNRASAQRSLLPCKQPLASHVGVSRCRRRTAMLNSVRLRIAPEIATATVGGARTPVGSLDRNDMLRPAAELRVHAVTKLVQNVKNGLTKINTFDVQSLDNLIDCPLKAG